eukprot:GEMP01097103.1.p1 GENE.GEMP01097103.1~~GEMP01097103.1.p1  ORF type:complete len:129 (+),score=22.43 GEMP01097103.1:53-439(+)
MVRVSFPTYLSCFICAPVFVAVNDIGRQNQLYMLVSLAWLLVLMLYLFGVNVHWIHSRLRPQLPEDSDGILAAFDEMTSVTHRTIRVATKASTLTPWGAKKHQYERNGEPSIRCIWLPPIVGRQHHAC